MKDYKRETIYVRLTDGPYPDDNPEQKIGALLRGKATIYPKGFSYFYNGASPNKWASTSLADIECREANKEETAWYEEGNISIDNMPKPKPYPTITEYLEPIIT